MTLHLTPSDYRRMPWRNGGGITTEILVEPSNVDVARDRFRYRVSIADVATDGPFSRFEGYDRHILLLSGAGMTLDCGAHGRIDLETPLEPHAFSGDWDVRGKLIDGPVRDFNVIVDRARASSSLHVCALDAPATFAVESETVCIVHVLAGDLEEAAEGDTLVADAPFVLAPRRAPPIAIAHVAIAHIDFRAAQFDERGYHSPHGAQNPNSHRIVGRAGGV